MKWGFKYTLIILAIVSGLAVLYVVSKVQYLYMVKPDLYQKFSALYKEYGEVGPGVLSNTDVNPININNNEFIRIRLERFEYINRNGSRVADSRDIIETSNDLTSWRTLLELPGFTCKYASVSGNRLFCAGPDVSIISVDLVSGRQSKIRGSTWSLRQLLGMYKENDNMIILIWRDSRARWPTIWGFIPLPTSAVVETGPWLIMAGELDSRTSRVRESVMQYGPYEFP